ncbi:hypothetical protein Zm00014a_001558 [Zea mays]|uniref:Uncharacterized protein n=1 Tax=Zea mays TaxID=4577 RepID=A0A3L6DCA0_MAIZE|nr:hypothetical protein Zm00014a_001558 [Zea mays]
MASGKKMSVVVIMFMAALLLVATVESSSSAAAAASAMASSSSDQLAGLVALEAAGRKLLQIDLCGGRFCTIVDDCCITNPRCIANACTA